MQNTINRSAAFTRQDTKAIKGIAVLLMLFHHLAGFPDRVPETFAGFRSLLPGFIEGGYLTDFAGSAKICVSLFFFLGGYGLYMRRKNPGFRVISEIGKLYRAYWKVFVIFIPVALIFFARNGEGVPSLCARYVFPSGKDMVTAVLAGFTGWSYRLNEEWWFFKSYVCLIPLGYLFLRAGEKEDNFWKELFAVFFIDVLIRDLLPALVSTGLLAPLKKNVFFSSFVLLNKYSAAFFAGIVMAKYDGLCFAKQKLQQLPFCVPVCVLALVGLWWCRTFVVRGEGDIVYCALMIPVASVLLDRAGPIKKAMVFFGGHSTNMWLTHSFFCYYFLEATKIVYISSSVWLDFVILTGLSLAASMAVNGIFKLPENLFLRRKTAGAFQKTR